MPPKPTSEWVERTKKRIVAALSKNDLNGWQEGFLASILAHLQEHGERRPLSDSQQLRLIEALEQAKV